MRVASSATATRTRTRQSQTKKLIAEAHDKLDKIVRGKYSLILVYYDILRLDGVSDRQNTVYSTSTSYVMKMTKNDEK